MNSIITLFKKETLDNLRDRKTLFNSLLFGPILGPIFLAVMMSFVINLQLDTIDEEIEFGAMNLDRAPHLVAFLKQNKIVFTDVADPDKSIRTREQVVVLNIAENFKEKFKLGQPAPIQLYYDKSRSKTDKDLGRLRNALRAYDQKIGTLRLMVRGIDTNIITPLNIQDNDLSTPESRGFLLLGMISYILFIVVMSGGMYLAIDSTAGERERHSLEPLLTLAVKRESIVLGKFFACCFFMTLALFLALISFKLSVPLMPLEELNISSNLSWSVIIKMFLIIFPFIFFAAGIMLLVASFTKSYKEAQTYLTFVIMVPAIPILIATVLTLEPSFASMFAPALSQHLLFSELLKDIPINLSYAFISTLSTLVFSTIVLCFVIKLYKRERILG